MNCVFSNILYPAGRDARTTTEIAVIPSHVYRRIHQTEKSVQSSRSMCSARIFDRVHAEDVTTLPRPQARELSLKKSGADLCVVMSHEEIASHLGTAREVVSRHMRT
jgi:CRP/FNR family transcriptional regulator